MIRISLHSKDIPWWSQWQQNYYDNQSGWL